MVELGSKSPYGQSFDNSVFILPALIVVAVVAFCSYKLINSLKEKELREKAKQQKKEEKKVKKTK